MVSSASVCQRDEHGAFIVGANDSLDGAETSGVCEHAAQSAMVEAGFAGATANFEASVWRDAGSAITCDGVVFIHRGEQCLFFWIRCKNLLRDVPWQVTMSR